MTFLDALDASGTTSVALLAGIAALFALEAWVWARPRGPWRRMHLRPNVVLTMVSIATGIVLNATVLLVLVATHDAGWSPLQDLGLGRWAAVVVVVVALDFATFLGHVAMHAVPFLWRLHLVHHSDPMVDVTTTVRQHPGEGLFRYLVLAGVAVAIGAGPLGFALYRGWSAAHALLEHADVRLPPSVDRALSSLFVTPNAHKVHHGRDATRSAVNFGNILSVFDRLFGRYRPADPCERVHCGLDGHDDPSAQHLLALLRAPVRSPATLAIVLGIGTQGCAGVVHCQRDGRAPLEAQSYAWAATDEPPGHRSLPAIRRGVDEALRALGLQDAPPTDADLRLGARVDTITRHRLEGDLSRPGTQHTRYTLHLWLDAPRGDYSTHSWIWRWSDEGPAREQLARDAPRLVESCLSPRVPRPALPLDF